MTNPGVAWPTLSPLPRNLPPSLGGVPAAAAGFSPGSTVSATSALVVQVNHFWEKMEGANEKSVVESVHSIVFKESDSLEGKREKIAGYDFNNGIDYGMILRSMRLTGFQASNLGDAIDVVNRMLDWRLSDEPITEDCDDEERVLSFRESVKCKVFLGFTSNLISSGLRETIRFLAEHHLVDVLVTTAGGIEEDLIKCLGPTYRGEFSLPGAYLRSRGINRIGNLMVPNDNYCKFEDWIMPIFEQMLQEQNEKVTLHILQHCQGPVGQHLLRHFLQQN